MIALSSLTPFRVVERNVMGYRRSWIVLVSGLFESIFYLFGLGVGLGGLVGDVPWQGESLTYAAFVAPGLVASSAMNGAVFDTTFNFFYKLTEARTFDGMLATPLTMRDILTGEILWAMTRGGIYSAVFLAVMFAYGLVASAWALLILPASLLVAACFAGLGSFCTTFVSSWQDFDLVLLVTQPLFLLSTTFFALDVYPSWAQPLVQATPLYHGVDLIRDLARGTVGTSDLGHVAYLLIVMAVSGWAATKRTGRLLAA